MKNTTPLTVAEYDSKIEKTLPYYSMFLEQILDVVRNFDFEEASWLDTGCGTGSMVSKAIQMFRKYQFTLCDPSEKMISQAKEKLGICEQIKEYAVCGSEQLAYENEFDIVTAVQCHHYLQEKEREKAVENCYKALKQCGVYIFFENFAPSSEKCKLQTLKRWGNYQKAHGKTEFEVKKHLERYGKNYFPITIKEHMRLLKKIGFKEMEIFWLSYMQVGIYALK